MNYHCRSILSKAVSWIISKIPTSNVICFNSFPDYADNSFAVYQYMIKHQFNSKFKLIWLVNDDSSINRITEDTQKNENVIVLRKKSIAGIWYYIRSRYVFFTHGILGTLNLRQHPDKMINLWHGMPLKNIGILDNKGQGYMENTDLMIATSPMFQVIMAKCFGIKKEKVLITGQPRCDLLFESTTFFTYAKIDTQVYKSIGVWLPTYRSSYIADIRTDGSYEEGRISFLSDKDLNLLNIFLRDNQFFLLIKLHPMDSAQQYEFQTLSNIFIIKQNSFKHQLYPLLGCCDYLLTDYSSVWVDYDILNKPIGFVMNDYKEYKNSRGFTVDNLLELLPGPVICNVQELESFILHPYRTNRDITFNTHKDNHSTQRLITYLNIS